MDRVLTSQDDPLGYSLPYTTRAKVIVQHLLGKAREWDDPNFPLVLLQAWNMWEKELSTLSTITLFHSLTPPSTDLSLAMQHLHIFWDASQVAWNLPWCRNCYSETSPAGLLWRWFGMPPNSKPPCIFKLSTLTCSGTRKSIIRVGRRLWQSSDPPPDAIHPTALDLAHSISKLIIKDYDDHLVQNGLLLS